MGNRKVRVNELVHREISEIMHTAYCAESVRITIIDVQIAPDLRAGRVYYSVIGGEAEKVAAAKFFARVSTDLHLRLGKIITLKYMPKLRFVYDNALARGSDLTKMIQELDEEDRHDDPQA